MTLEDHHNFSVDWNNPPHALLADEHVRREDVRRIDEAIGDKRTHEEAMKELIETVLELSENTYTILHNHGERETYVIRTNEVKA